MQQICISNYYVLDTEFVTIKKAEIIPSFRELKIFYLALSEREFFFHFLTALLTWKCKVYIFEVYNFVSSDVSICS